MLKNTCLMVKYVYLVSLIIFNPREVLPDVACYREPGLPLRNGTSRR